MGEDAPQGLTPRRQWVGIGEVWGWFWRGLGEWSGQIVDKSMV